jgi:hypothetical protein
VIGTTAPAATRPLTLFSSVSSTSSGFFVPGGSTVPSTSLAAQAAAMSRAGSQNFNWANQGNFARATALASVVSPGAVSHW